VTKHVIGTNAKVVTILLTISVLVSKSKLAFKLFKVRRVTKVKSFSFQMCRDRVRLTTEQQELDAIFAESISISLRDTISARMLELTVISTAAQDAIKGTRLCQA